MVTPGLAQLSDPRKVGFQQSLEECLGAIPAIAEALTGEAFDPAGYRVPIIDVTGGALERPSLTAVMDHPVELEPGAPPDRGWAAPGDLFEDFRAGETTVRAHP